MAATDGHYGTGQLPLAGAILCCTALPHEQRAQLSSIGAQMGATIKLDLTSDVTHLVAGNTDSAKYRYVAKLREDVKVLSPAWLEALRDVWMEGEDDMDVAGLEKQYRLPTFYGLRICLTGFDNPERRKYIQETVDQNGAEYHGDLTKNITHLIAAAPTGKKYEHALNWRMKIVSLEWFEQSLERGMVLDETLFNPTLPVDERGIDAWIRIEDPSPALGKRLRDTEQPQPLNPNRRKLRRAASTKLGIQGDALWAEITTPSFDQGRNEEDEWKEDNLFKHTTPQQDSPAVPHDDKAADRVETKDANAPTPAAPAAPAPQLLEADDNEGIFQGRVVVIHGFDQDKTTILHEHLEKNGAHALNSNNLEGISSENLTRGFLVIPHDVEVDVVSGSLPARAGTIGNLVTNWWVERCLHGKCLVDPTTDVLSRPFDKLSINGFSGLTVNSTGFSGIGLLHVTKALTLMGATYDEQLHAKTSVMLCNSRNPAPQKLKFATERRIPAVHAEWLWECLRTGALQPFSNFLLNTFAPRQPQKILPNPQAFEKLTVAPSKEDDPKPREQQRRTDAPKMVTKPHHSRARGPLKPRVLDLGLSAEGTPASTTDPLTLPADSTSNARAFDNDDNLGGFDGNASMPLHDTDANSTRRPSTSLTGLLTNDRSKARHRSSSAESLIRAAPAPRVSKTAREPTPDSVIPAPSEPQAPVPAPVSELDTEPRAQEPIEEKDYSDLLTKLRNNRKAAPTPEDQADEKRRRRRQLGRAPSARSIGSAGDASSGNLGLDDDEDDGTVVINEYQPSQVLGWDSPGAAKAREVMIKKLGGTLKDKSVPVKAIGGAMDGPSESGMTSRAGRKRRPGF